MHEVAMRTRGTHVGFDTVLDVWYSGHDIVQGGDVRDDGLLIWMGHVHICRESTQLKTAFLSQKLQSNCLHDDAH